LENGALHLAALRHHAVARAQTAPILESGEADYEVATEYSL
jgi:hypothetical protein